jgi:hypothetical protein
MLTRLAVVAADHPWRLDLSSLAAILTGAGTALLALFTWRLARQTRTLASETEQDVRSTFRPVLIGAKGGFEAMVFSDPNAGPLEAVLVNVGSGPAINTVAVITSSSSTATVSSDRLNIGTIAPDGDAICKAELPIRDASGGSNAFLAYEIIAEYEDVAGRSYTTELRYEDPEKGRREHAGGGGAWPITFPEPATKVYPTPQGTKSAQSGQK